MADSGEMINLENRPFHRAYMDHKLLCPSHHPYLPHSRAARVMKTTGDESGTCHCSKGAKRRKRGVPRANSASLARISYLVSKYVIQRT